MLPVHVSPSLLVGFVVFGIGRRLGSLDFGCPESERGYTALIHCASARVRRICAPVVVTTTRQLGIGESERRTRTRGAEALARNGLSELWGQVTFSGRRTGWTTTLVSLALLVRLYAMLFPSPTALIW